MINAAALLTDLKRLSRRLDRDLRETHAKSEARAAVEAEWREARDAGRTAEAFESFFDTVLDQSIVHWILAFVFVRFLEDNDLIDRPLLGGRGERLDIARERHAAYFRERPHDSDREYLFSVFAEIARLPGAAGLFDQVHNPLFRLPLSGDGAIALREFFQAVVAETGAPTHDFGDPNWNTRFLGDLYQDLSEDARKRYALLQTPDFVEQYILDRTLEPAIREFGFREVTMIDPTCGSGHFLLGGFARLLREWEHHAPDLPSAARAQRALDHIAGIDLNPFAIEIARFRLLLAAIRASDVKRLRNAPDFRFNLASGDSLLHGRHFTRQELGGAEEGFRRVLRHHFAAEDTADLNRILGRQYHSVVGNPPYITPKDPAMREAYREIYKSCYRTYGLGAPFTERFFDLAEGGADRGVVGYVGLIAANNFMKREFGKKLVEDVLPNLDLTHVVNCDGVALPGHGIPTVILFGRNRPPISNNVRAVMGIKGDPPNLANVGNGPTWTAILSQTDLVGSVSDFISVIDIDRATLAHHPWSMGGGGASELKDAIEGACRERLCDQATSIGFYQDTHADEAFVQPSKFFARMDIVDLSRPQVRGDECRDWVISSEESILFPYDQKLRPLRALPATSRLDWFVALRTTLWGRSTFGGGTYRSARRPWFDYHQFPIRRASVPLSIAFAFVSTHNHFILDHGGRVFNRSAPIIKLAVGASEQAHLGIVGLLNSSTACFWMKQVMHNKGGQGVNEGAKVEIWERFIEVAGTALLQFPIATPCPTDLAAALNDLARSAGINLPSAIVDRALPTPSALSAARSVVENTRARMVACQEELDWRCYRLYGLLDEALEEQDPPPLQLGERAFEIYMARGMRAGELTTAWFDRHGSMPITDLPEHWPAGYRALVERRIALIESEHPVSLIERPEYKRRWATEPWKDMEQKALRDWLLDRLEERHFWPNAAELISTNQLADRARLDIQFMSVAAQYVGRADFDLETIMAELVSRESVPFLAALRYGELGLRKRVRWEETWRLQRREDAIDAEVAARRSKFLEAAELRARQSWLDVNPRRPDEPAEAHESRLAQGLSQNEIEAAADARLAAEQERRKREEVGDIPAPPRYRRSDFLSADFWRLRGSLDVPKERFVSFPHCSRNTDGSLVITWAGHDHLARATAIGNYYQARKAEDGWDSDRLKLLLAGISELQPQLGQWHNEYDPAVGMRMGDYFAEFVREESRNWGLSEAELAEWRPPVQTGRRRRRSS
jgi:hypothetical protein